MSWSLFVLLAVVCYSLLGLAQRSVAVGSNNPRVTTILFNSLASLGAISIFLLSGTLKNFSLPTEPKAWIALGIVVLFYGLFERYRFHVAKLLDASTLSIFFNLSVLVAFTASALIYREILAPNTVLGALLIITALTLVSINRKAQKKSKKLSKKAVLFGVLNMTLLGAGWSLDKMGATYFGAATYSMLIWPLPLVIIMFPGVKWAELKQEFHTAGKLILISAGLNVAAYFFLLKGLELANATKVIPLSQTATILTIILGMLFLKETDRFWQKIIAGFLAVGGVYLLV